MAYQRRKRSKAQPQLLTVPQVQASRFISTLDLPVLADGESGYVASTDQSKQGATLEMRRQQAQQPSLDFGRIPIFAKEPAVLRQPQSFPSPLIQAKLTVGPVGDRYEQEADRVAAQVLSTINQPQGKAPVQRESDPDGNVIQHHPVVKIQRMEANDDDDMQMQPQVTLQRDAVVGHKGCEVSANMASQINRAKGGGQSLDAGLQRSMGQAMGADFSGVKVHHDAQSDQLNHVIQAKAFTTGSDVFFKQGAYNPSSRGGQELIAHELAHVVQQGGAAQGVQRQSDGVIQRDGMSIGLSNGPQKNANGATLLEDSALWDQSTLPTEEQQKREQEFKEQMELRETEFPEQRKLREEDTLFEPEVVSNEEIGNYVGHEKVANQLNDLKSSLRTSGDITPVVWVHDIFAQSKLGGALPSKQSEKLYRPVITPASFETKLFSDQLSGEELDVYRGEKRLPNLPMEDDGFYGRMGNDFDLALYTEEKQATSGKSSIVSTSQNIQVGVRFAGATGFIYKLNLENVPRVYIAPFSRYSDEGEVELPYGVGWDHVEIVKSAETGETAVLKGITDRKVQRERILSILSSSRKAQVTGVEATQAETSLSKADNHWVHYNIDRFSKRSKSHLRDILIKHGVYKITKSTTDAEILMYVLALFRNEGNIDDLPSQDSELLDHALRMTDLTDNAELTQKWQLEDSRADRKTSEKGRREMFPQWPSHLGLRLFDRAKYKKIFASEEPTAAYDVRMHEIFSNYTTVKDFFNSDQVRFTWSNKERERLFQPITEQFLNRVDKGPYPGFEEFEHPQEADTIVPAVNPSSYGYSDEAPSATPGQTVKFSTTLNEYLYRYASRRYR